MKRLSLAVGALILALGCTAPQPASALVRRISFSNQSTNCVWLTIYMHTDFGWEIVKRGPAHPHYVAPGQTLNETAATVGIRIRSQVLPGPACSGDEKVNLIQGFVSQSSRETIYADVTLHGNNQIGFRY